MRTDYTGLTVCAVTDTERFAAELFCDALEARCGVRPPVTPDASDNCVRLCADLSVTDKDAFSIRQTEQGAQIVGQGVRALIFGFSFFLRKCVFQNGSIQLVCTIGGDYTPDKRIRGHQLGFRAISNTYDAWTIAQYRQYYLDMMAFGSNTVEHIPALASADRSAVMRYEPDDVMAQGAAVADTFDLDVSLWTPNDSRDMQESIRLRRAAFEKCPRLNVVFPPGGDPGDYPADEFLTRVCAIGDALRQSHPDAQMWPSAQAPHAIPNWGEQFIDGMTKEPPQIDGVITGPNRAFPLDELRRKLPMRYPIRLYPDITHNVRCEYPVHTPREDWHYALATALSRECINPRPQEYRQIHRLTRPYVIGSVSYSEGVNDDVNKMVWADMDFDPARPLRETLLDYARFFLWQADAEQIADLILSLERNWQGDPAENPHIEDTLRRAETLADDTPALLDNWRFCQLLFRAVCDAFVRRRRLFEMRLLEEARSALRTYDVERAAAILSSPDPQACAALRKTIDALAGRLYAQIGMQLDVARFGASHWERGATLETLDLPVTDRRFYLNRLAFAGTLPADTRKAFFDGLLSRNTVRSDEMYFSFAEHGLDALGETQTPDYYMDFQGDRPNVNNGSIPMCQLKLYDHYSLRCKVGGLTAGDYRLRVSFSSRKNADVTQHTVTVNGHTIYRGAQYGGERDETFDAWYLAPGTETATYRIPASALVNGCAEIVIEEPTVGVQLSEFWILRA